MKRKKRAKTPGSGRKKGSRNKVTLAFKEAVLRAYDGIGGDRAFQLWATRNRTEYYKIAARLIPHEVVGPSDGSALPLQIILTDYATPAAPDTEQSLS